MEIGSTIRRLRKIRVFHQDSFAALCGLAQGHLSQIENDRREPSFALLNRLSKHLEVPVPVISFLFMQEKDVVLGKNDILRQFKTIINDFTVRYSTKEYKLPNHLQSILGFPNNQLV